MSNRIVIEVSETDHGFVARIPGMIAAEIRGFSPTIPGALRRVGEGLVDFKEALRNNGFKAEYTDVIAELSYRQKLRGIQ